MSKNRDYVERKVKGSEGFWGVVDFWGIWEGVINRKGCGCDWEF